MGREERAERSGQVTAGPRGGGGHRSGGSHQRERGSKRTPGLGEAGPGVAEAEMPCAGGLGQVPRVAEAGGRLARGRGPQEPHSARLPFLQKHPAPQDLTSGRGVRLGGRSCAPFPTASPANNLQPAPPGRPRSNPARPTVQVCSLKARVSRLPAFKPRRDRTSHFQINTALKARSHFFKSPRSPGACKPSKSSPVWSSGQRSPAPRVARLRRAAGAQTAPPPPPQPR